MKNWGVSTPPRGGAAQLPAVVSDRGRLGQRQAYIGGPIIYGGPINNVIDNMYDMSY